METGKIPIQQWRNFTGYGSEWADPLDEPDEATMAKVKNLYITKLTDSVTEDDLSERFTPYGNVERVRKVIAFLTLDSGMAQVDVSSKAPNVEAWAMLRF